MSATGFAALVVMLTGAAKSETGILFGYSLARLLIFAITAGGALTLAVCAAASWRQPGWWHRLAVLARRLAGSPERLFALIAVLFAVFLALLSVLWLSLSSASHELTVLRALIVRAGPLLMWIELVILLSFVLIALNIRIDTGGKPFLTMLRFAILLAIATVIYAATLKIYAAAVWDTRFLRIDRHIYLPALNFLLWGLFRRYAVGRNGFKGADRIFLLLSIGVLAYTLYRHTSEWVDWQVTPSKAYWHLLADSFLKGRLYLVDPPTTHDLTL